MSSDEREVNSDKTVISHLSKSPVEKSPKQSFSIEHLIGPESAKSRIKPSTDQLSLITSEAATAAAIQAALSVTNPLLSGHSYRNPFRAGLPAFPGAPTSVSSSISPISPLNWTSPYTAVAAVAAASLSQLSGGNFAGTHIPLPAEFPHIFNLNTANAISNGMSPFGPLNLSNLSLRHNFLQNIPQFQTFAAAAAAAAAQMDHASALLRAAGSANLTPPPNSTPSPPVRVDSIDSVSSNNSSKSLDILNEQSSFQ